MTLTTQYNIIKRDGRIIKDSQCRSIPANPGKRAERLKGLDKAWQKLQDDIEYFLTSKLYEMACIKQHKTPYIHSARRKKKSLILTCGNNADFISSTTNSRLAKVGTFPTYS